jgi:fucose 4-O-acetylase-like acetyltransferase
MAQLKPQIRLDWIDYTKGLGIFLVVLGHTLRGLIGDTDNLYPKEWDYLDAWIYSFHMPLFFFLSGLLSYRMGEKSYQQFISEKIRTIFYPYILWTFIIQGIRVLSGKENTNFLTFILNFWTVVYQPIGIFWFLYALFLISLTHFALMRLSKSSWSIIIGSLCLYFFHASFPTSIGWDAFRNFAIYSLYFTCGILVRKQFLLSQMPIKNSLLLLASIIGFSITSIAPILSLKIFSEPSPVIAAFGIIASISLAKILDERRWMPCLRTWGQCSLQIYVVHTATAAIARPLLKKVLHIDDLNIHLFIGVLAGIYGSLLLNSIALRLNWKYLFILPKQLFQQNRNS